MARRTSTRSRYRPEIVSLEGRSLLAVTFQIDYSLDTNNFFNTQAKRDLLQLAADVLAGRLDDTLQAIAPSGTNTWSARFTPPGTGTLQAVANLSAPANTIIIYAGGRDL